MLMDWREMAGRPSFRRLHGEDRWNSFTGAWSGGKKVAEAAWFAGMDEHSDSWRGWILALCWMLASGAECVASLPSLVACSNAVYSIYYLYAIIRRPRLILDFSLTLLFNHLVLTTYYSAAIPTSLFFWAVMMSGSALTIIVAEQLCVKREMTEGLIIATEMPDGEDMEMGSMRRD